MLTDDTFLNFIKLIQYDLLSLNLRFVNEKNFWTTLRGMSEYHATYVKSSSDNC